MLKGKLLHPEILRALGACGHFSRILIADGNYPVATMSRPESPKVFLNLTPGIPTVSQVLLALLEAVPVQAAAVVRAPDDALRAAQQEYRTMLPAGTEVTELDRLDFYAQVKSTDIGLIVATADIRRFANLLLTVGVVKYDA